ncbi:MAG: sugar phosphate isomerase/epimerase family protein [Bryobacterales bacterium]
MAQFPVCIITDEFSQDFELVCGTARELGVPALEVRTAWNKNIVDLNDDEISEVKRLAESAGLTIASIASPVYKCTLPEGGDIDRRFEQDAFHSAHSYEDQPRILKRSLEVAAKLGAPVVRVFSFWRTVEPAATTGRVIEALSKAVETARPYGVRIGLENEHACNVATAAETAPVLNLFDDPLFGLVWDPANAYVAGEVPYPDGYRLLPARRIIHVHAKDGVMPPGSDRMNWGDVGAGEVDWKGQLASLITDGYQGMISLETHWGGPAGNKFEGSKICARSLQRLVAEA